MGLNYDSGDSNSLKSALSANIAAASSVLDASGSACDRLVAGLGTGKLSGKGYSAVDALFAQAIKPCVADTQREIASIKKALDTYTWEDSKVSHWGVLKEDELNAQLKATKTQRDATQHQIEVNRRAADSATAVPGLCDALRAKNCQLELVLNQLEKDLLELEAKVQALRAFAAATTGLFKNGLNNLAAAAGDTVDLLNDLTKPVGGPGAVISGGAVVLQTIDTRKKILDLLAGTKLTVDSKGRVKAGSKFIYNPGTRKRYDGGRVFNEATGTRIDNYKRPIKAGGTAALKAPIEDFTGWNDVGKLGKFGKGLGIADVGLTVGGDAYKYFGDGDVTVTDWPDFATDTGVDLATGAVAAGVGAVVGSAILPPAGTIVGALVGFVVGLALDPAADAAKTAIKETYH